MGVPTVRLLTLLGVVAIATGRTTIGKALFGEEDLKQRQLEGRKKFMGEKFWQLEVHGGHSKVRRSLPVVSRTLPDVVLALPQQMMQPMPLLDAPPGATDQDRTAWAAAITGRHVGQTKMVSVDKIELCPKWRPVAMAEIEATRTEANDALIALFPGQFFSPYEVNTIAHYEVARVRRELDRDICCRTDVWFGTAPTELVNVDGEGPMLLLKGQDVFQAYARGDCHDHAPHPSCPPNGQCRQKKRLHMLWVQTGTEAVMKYFRINSHCAYELDNT